MSRVVHGWFQQGWVLALIAPVFPACGPSGSPGNEIQEPLWPMFSGENAYRHCAALVDFGPRPAGSPSLERSRAYLTDQLREVGWEVSRQAFDEPTPNGTIGFVNVRARFGAGADLWDKPVQVLVGSHYDTKYFERIRFVGANDGGSSSAALLEMARVLGERPDLAARVELVFFDGEEAFESYTATDGLYGSRKYAREITRRQRPKDQPRAVIILDMIGDKDLHVKIPSDTPRDLAEKLFAAAREVGTESLFGRRSTPVMDDHVPFQLEGVPAINLIDLDYGPWHTSGDTMDQISAESLEAVGRTAVCFLESLLAAR